MPDATPPTAEQRAAAEYAYHLSVMVHEEVCGGDVPHDIGIKLYETIVGPAIRAAEIEAARQMRQAAVKEAESFAFTSGPGLPHWNQACRRIAAAIAALPLPGSKGQRNSR